MSEIFVSHSSFDNDQAAALAEWLRQRNLTSVFLDFDPDAGIPGGRDWEAELYARLNSCRAVVALCSRKWMKSRWCFAEIAHARAMGKVVIPIRLDDCQLDPVLERLQVIDLGTSTENAYARLERALLSAGIKPRRIVERDPLRPPFPGLEPFQEQDADCYFGREGEIDEVVARLNRRRLIGSEMLVIIGTSGVGKSSFLRAGVLPRLRTQPQEWLIVEPFRPGRNPLLALESTIAGTTAHGESPERFAMDLLAHADRLRLELRQPHANLLISVDQWEELFSISKPESAASFSRVLHLLISEPGARVTVLATLRSDFVPDLLANAELRTGEFEMFALTPIARSAVTRIIVESATVANLRVEPALTTHLADDFDDRALPMLAFVLRELYERADTGVLRDRAYTDIGGLPRAIAEIAEECLPELSEELNEELRRALLRLARIGDDGRFARRAAYWNDLPCAARPVLERLIKARVIVSFNQEHRRVLEIAHEAVFQAWPRLEEWLKDARDKLLAAARLAQIAQQWIVEERAEALLWRGSKLESALELESEGLVDESGSEFLARARKKDKKERELEKKRQRYRVLRLQEMKQSLEPAMMKGREELEHWKKVVAERGAIAGLSSLKDAENALDVLNNLLAESGRWHPQAAESVHTMPATADYTDVYRFSCCGRTVWGNTTPSQLRVDGCETAPGEEELPPLDSGASLR